MPDRVHIFGGSGSGTTTLALALAAAHGHRHLDTDDFYWLPTNPPYREPRPREERLALLQSALDASPRWVLSGSLCGWGDSLIPTFELVVFLVVPTELRLARLQARELVRYGGEAIGPGGPLYPAHQEFLDWAGRYDTGDLEMRSRARHEAWLAGVPSASIRLEGSESVPEQLKQIEAAVKSQPSQAVDPSADRRAGP